MLSQSGIYCISLKPIVASISYLIQEFERKAVTFENVVLLPSSYFSLCLSIFPRDRRGPVSFHSVTLIRKVSSIVQLSHVIPKINWVMVYSFLKLLR